MINTLFIDLDGTLVDSRAALKALFGELADKYFGGKALGDVLRGLFKENCLKAFHTLPHSDYLQDIGCGWDNMFYSDFTGDELRLADLKNAAAEYRHSVLSAILKAYGKTDYTLAESMITFMREKWVEYYRPYTDAYTFLDGCKDFKKYIFN